MLQQFSEDHGLPEVRRAQFGSPQRTPCGALPISQLASHL